MLHPQGLEGPWKAGIVLDWHTIGSEVVGEDELGHPIFSTQRSEIGELLYRFKYRNDEAAFGQLMRLCNDYLIRRASGKFEIVLPVPPSNARRMVTRRIAAGIAAGLGLNHSHTAITKVKNTSELKSIADAEVRKELLRDAFRVDRKQVESKKVLLVDDVYRSGATLESAAEAVTDQGNPKVLYVLAVTRTRVHR
jgi:predicted amidophosphoribosyltransferase